MKSCSAADTEPEQPVEHEHQHQREQEVGRGQPDEAGEREAVVEQRVLAGGRVDPDRDRHRVGEDQGRQGHQHGEPEPFPDQLRHRLVPVERYAEVAVHHAPQPDQVLLPDRLVEAVAAPQRVQRLVVAPVAGLRQLGLHGAQVIARRKLDEEEADDRDDQQRRHHVEQPPPDVTEHPTGSLLSQRSLTGRPPRCRGASPLTCLARAAGVTRRNVN